MHKKAIIRQEEKIDHAAVFELVKDAFEKKEWWSIQKRFLNKHISRFHP